MAAPGNQAAKRKYKHQPIVSEETGLLDSKVSASIEKMVKRPREKGGPVNIKHDSSGAMNKDPDNR